LPPLLLSSLVSWSFEGSSIVTVGCNIQVQVVVSMLTGQNTRATRYWHRQTFFVGQPAPLHSTISSSQPALQTPKPAQEKANTAHPNATPANKQSNLRRPEPGAKNNTRINETPSEPNAPGPRIRQHSHHPIHPESPERAAAAASAAGAGRRQASTP